MITTASATTASATSILRRLWSWLPLPLGWVRHIPRELGQKYLDRYSIRKQRPSGQNQWRVYLHAFHAPDSEGHHNHPCRFGWAIVLRGSYTEEVLEECPMCVAHPIGGHVRSRRIRWFNWVPASKYHRIVTLHPRRPGEAVWTLFFMGPLARHPRTGAPRGWGFWVPGRGHVPHEVREAERALEAAKARVFAEHAI